MTSQLDDLRTGLNRGFTYGLFGDPDPFMTHVRDLGGRFVRLNLFWSQLEPAPGDFDWKAADAFFDQLQEGDEAWVTVCSSSTWATRRPTRFLPSSPAADPGRYRAFVGALVRRAAGRVRFWQCEVEPCVPMLWAGSAGDYVSHLRAFHDAVKQADPDALVGLGAAVPGAMIADGRQGDGPWADYVDRILRDGRDHFDVFDIHPYGDPYRIPELIDACRRQMARHGYGRPIVASEYNGPMPTGFPANFAALRDVLAGHRRQFLGEVPVPEGGPGAAPDDPAVVALYERAAELPETLRMFLTGCPPELVARRQRLAGRDIVARTLLLLSAGVRRTACFQIAPEGPHANPRTVRGLMFDTFALMDGDFRRHPTADVFALMSRRLATATEVRRVATPPGRYVFDVRRERGAPILVAWQDGDDHDHDHERGTGSCATGGGAEPFVWPWPAGLSAEAVDAFGAAVPFELADGVLRLPLSSDPVFVTPKEFS
ncbi:hypothetical protein GBF35_46990 [Nonomuraea phyllanthi]|uniref:hypothetical protein n=1 Tax=Nonomuraea phyllanthi TaxID=2219224 RepID=UPI001292D038|nr:hypothetical protein [Nonomuraea phyllanthi]QFY13116.1 hypothetical protein GBF35_46990 [Nonomuraea phyllanthi]